jgi:hypothetical protein
MGLEGHFAKAEPGAVNATARARARAMKSAFFAIGTSLCEFCNLVAHIKGL